MQESRQGESADCPAIPAVAPAPAAPVRGDVLRHDASVIRVIDGLVGADSYARMGVATTAVYGCAGQAAAAYSLGVLSGITAELGRPKLR